MLPHRDAPIRGHEAQLVDASRRGNGPIRGIAQDAQGGDIQGR